MALLSFDSDSDSFLWMGEAISEKIVKTGDLLDVVSITLSGDGRGFLIECVFGETTVYDYAWKKGKTGQTLLQLFDDPTQGDGNKLMCKAQVGIKNAVLKAVEQKGCRWELRTQGEKEILCYLGKQKEPAKFRTQETSESPLAS